MLLQICKVIVTLTVTLYTIPLTTWLLQRWWYGESLVFVGFMNAVGVWWFLPLIILFPLALLFRVRQALIILSLLLIPAIYFFGAEFIPHFSPTVAEDATRVKVLSFNMLTSNIEYNQVIDLIETYQPDIVAIQELSIDMSLVMNDELGHIYPYQEVYAWDDPRGIGIWSQYPLTEGPWRTINAWERWLHSATVEIEGKQLFLLNVHLWPTGTLDQALFARALEIQEKQVSEIKTLISAETKPTLLLGDFNASPTNETYTSLAQELDDTWRQVGFGPGFTFPSTGSQSLWLPRLLRIDYFWTKGAIKPLSLDVLPDSAGSDHFPLLGEFVLE